CQRPREREREGEREREQVSAAVWRLRSTAPCPVDGVHVLSRNL
ncbi:unnamed protein product, partial [Musa acuminata subsp. burmannicoides]